MAGRIRARHRPCLCGYFRCVPRCPAASERVATMEWSTSEYTGSHENAQGIRSWDGLSAGTPDPRTAKSVTTSIQYQPDSKNINIVSDSLQLRELAVKGKKQAGDPSARLPHPIASHRIALHRIPNIATISRIAHHLSSHLMSVRSPRHQNPRPNISAHPHPRPRWRNFPIHSA